MSACHSRVAVSLLPAGSMLEQALDSSSFWRNNVENFLPMYLMKDIQITNDQLKKILKVFLYTSLNGGNPGSHDRLIDNLTDNARNLIPKKKLTSSDLYLQTKAIAESFQLLQEVKNFNKSCFMNGCKYSYTYTVDRVNPYRNHASYKGISRVLQGFEVVLLSCLTKYVISS